MKKDKQRLTKAIILGLLLSSAFASQAWAKIDENLVDVTTTLTKTTYTADSSDNATAMGLNVTADTGNANVTVEAGDNTITLTSNATDSNLAYGLQNHTLNGNTVGRAITTFNTNKDLVVNTSSEKADTHGLLAGSGDIYANVKGQVFITSTAQTGLGTGILTGATNGTSEVRITSQQNNISASNSGVEAYTQSAHIILNAISNDQNLGNNIITIDGINGTSVLTGITAWDMGASRYGSGQVTLNADQDNSITIKNAETGIAIYSVGNGAEATLNAKNKNVLSADDYGIYALTNAKAKLEAPTNEITAPIAAFSYEGADVTITATDTNKLTGDLLARIDGKITVESKNTNTITGDLSARTNGQITTTSTNATNLTGDALNEGGTITLNMGTGSKWDGKSTMQDSTDAASGVTYSAVTKATLGADSVWNLTDDSQLTTLDATNSTINMVGNAKKLTMNNLLGGGNTFKMDLKYLGDGKTVSDYQASAETDFVTVTDRSSGTNTLLFAPSGDNVGAMSKADQKLYFAQIAGSAGFTMDTATAVDASKLYDREYKVKSEENAAGAGTDWYIGLDETQPDDPVDPKPNENVISEKGKMMAAYALGTDMDRLNKRLGEARYLEDEKGVWVRYRHNRIGWDKSYKTNGNMFQVGYDKERIEKDGKHYRGGAIDYTRASTTLQDVVGKGNHDRYGISLYDTWIGDKGHYHDLVLRGGRINNEFDVRNRVNETIHSDYHRNFASISGEYGRKIDGKDGWYIEPQTQLQIARIGSGSYTTDKGVHAEQDGATSVIGRLGFRLGRETFNADGNKANNYYFKADLMHEFAGDQGYTLTAGNERLSEKFDGQDTWFDIGFGADIKLSNKNTFFVDVERTLGSDFKSTWQVNGGFRWEF